MNSHCATAPADCKAFVVGTAVVEQVRHPWRLPSTAFVQMHLVVVQVCYIAGY